MLPSMTGSMNGYVALVSETEAGAEDCRDLALALAARGARVVVAGPVEKVVAEVVGEIAFGGGKARHVVGGVDAGVTRAVETFGGVDLVVAGKAEARRLLDALELCPHSFK